MEISEVKRYINSKQRQPIKLPKILYLLKEKENIILLIASLTCLLMCLYSVSLGVLIGGAVIGFLCGLYKSYCRDIETGILFSVLWATVLFGLIAILTVIFACSPNLVEHLETQIVLDESMIEIDNEYGDVYFWTKTGEEYTQNCIDDSYVKTQDTDKYTLIKRETTQYKSSFLRKHFIFLTDTDYTLIIPINAQLKTR